MKVRIEIATDNAAFSDCNAGAEVARILREAADKVQDWPGKNKFEIGLRDLNGNKVGAIKAGGR